MAPPAHRQSSGPVAPPLGPAPAFGPVVGPGWQSGWFRKSRPGTAWHEEWRRPAASATSSVRGTARRLPGRPRRRRRVGPVPPATRPTPAPPETPPRRRAPRGPAGRTPLGSGWPRSAPLVPHHRPSDGGVTTGRWSQWRDVLVASREPEGRFGSFAAGHPSPLGRGRGSRHPRPIRAQPWSVASQRPASNGRCFAFPW
jgi:hypothetical protein